MHLARSFLTLATVYCLVQSSRASVLTRGDQEAGPGTSLHRRSSGEWYHADGHPAYALFRRQDSNETIDGIAYAQVGSPTWLAAFPTSSPDPSNLPQAWVDALDAAASAGKIPDIPQSTMSPDGNPVYPDSLDPTGPEVCSGTYKCQIDDDIWDAPDGVVGAGFDDGPLPTSTQLYEFLNEQGVHATHFMIGVNILWNSDEFLMAFQTNQDDIAVHTWTHPYMTTLSNLQIVGELGWTMQLIHNSTGGRLPRFWRPPYGDTDTRVHAIAQEVFGLTTIMWNHDTEDWSLTEPDGTTPSAVHAELAAWYGGPKSPGLIVLEHELSNLSVQAYVDAFPLIAQNGWALVSAARLDARGAYQNVVAPDPGDEAAPGDVGQVLYAGRVLAFSAPPTAVANATSARVAIVSTEATVSSTSASVTSASATSASSSHSASASPTKIATGAQKSGAAPCHGMAPIATIVAFITFSLAALTL